MPTEQKTHLTINAKAMMAHTYDRQKIRTAPDVKAGGTHPAIADVQGYLKRYGYLDPAAAVAADKLDAPTMAALKAFQAYAKIPATSILDEPTKAKMAMDRCGIPDDPLAFHVAGPWNHRNLTYRFGTLCADVSAAVARNAVRRAMDTWTNAGCGLTFTEVTSGTHDMFIEWRAATDPDHSMVGGVVAHSDFPPPNSIIVSSPPLPLHFDDSEDVWVDGAVVGALDIETVALHEIGHILGMYHSDVASSVMYPYVSTNHLNRALTSDDLSGIRTLYPPTSNWGSLGGVIVGDPSVVAWGPNRLDVFVRGTDNHVYHKAWDGSAWRPSVSGYEDQGGIITANIAVDAWATNRLDVFVRGTDAALYHKAWNGAWHPSLTGYENLGGAIVGDPSVVSWAANRLDILAEGTDGAVYHKAWDGAAWRPSATGYENLGGRITSKPVIVSWGTNRLDIFVRGTDGALYHKAWDGAAWRPSITGWENLGGTFTGDPAVVSWGANRLDIFVRGTDGAVYHKWWNGSAWGPSLTGYENMGGQIKDNPVAVCWGPNRIDLFVRGMDDAVWHKAWNGSAWGPSLTGWESLGGRITSRIAAASWAVNRLDLFVRGTDGGLYHKAWNGSAWTP